MILYQVRNGVISVHSVSKETKTGWREHNNGFINRRVMNFNYPSLNTNYYTVCKDEAMQWRGVLVNHLYDIIQVSGASLSDLEEWSSNGEVESDLPKSRMIQK